MTLQGMYITIQSCKLMSNQKLILLDRIMALVVKRENDDYTLPSKECVKVK
jgi:hypothetical protein